MLQNRKQKSKLTRLKILAKL